jgi:hypothetical protein
MRGTGYAIAKPAPVDDWEYDKKEIPGANQKALSQILRVIGFAKADIEHK